MAAPAALLAWCVQHLRGDFGLDVGEEVVRYILSIRDEEEIREYVLDLLQGAQGSKSLFVEELLARWRQASQLPPQPLPACCHKEEAAGAPRAAEQARKAKRKGRNKQELPAQAQPGPQAEDVKTPLDLAKAQEGGAGPAGGSKRKAKFVSLYSREGQDRLAVLLPGRHPCECLAQRHRLLNNCLRCGRIVCQQEGSGPCLTCGALVCTKEEQDILQRDSNKSQKLLKKLMAGAEGSGNLDARSKELLPGEEARLKAGLEQAVKHKDKLLEFDRTSVRRTRVIDDECDYFAADSNQWLSGREREALRRREQELRELRHAARRAATLSLDFAGRRVLEDSAPQRYHSRLDETIEAIHCGTLSQPATSPEAESCGVLVNPRLLQPAPLWVEQAGLVPVRRGSPGAEPGTEPGAGRSRLRIQDRELQEISDQGWCLSMHQPWASLLVRGIKRVEGRTWYSSHRGRLWIAATARSPSAQEISELEATYRLLLQEDVEFPSDYPSGCLLGCVDVADCLSQEQFKEQHPELSQESASPFVFICTNPQEMAVKFPIKGKHKIWRLDAKIHQGARKGLMKQKARG
ncbi:activating signal cointegrator 1 [Dryobates pubescens]|uniref:activating signal cointegrator 1 n=1 Tax=Dryobates pubescens TaxID=118200 RepID=UPI0023B92BB5|nr:activating signal cointegrator 1 [Dryobates pubescens]